jgi:hypothetical protein
MKKKLIGAGLLVLAVGLILRFQSQPLLQDVLQVVQLKKSNPTLPKSSSSADSSMVHIPKHGTVAQIDPEFRQWLQTEAKQLDLPRVDGARKEFELRQIVKRLNESQKKQLMQTVIDTSAAASEQILSVYMLVQAAAREELGHIVTAPAKVQGATPAHSESEALAMRDRALKTMALDGLIEHARGNPQEIVKLAEIIQNISDPVIRSRAQKELAQIQK